MTSLNTRRDVLKGGLALAGLGVAGLPEWMLPALAQGETLVPFTDLPASINLTPAPDRRMLDVRTITGPLTPKDQFFTTQHYGHPQVDAAAYPAEGQRARPAAEVAVAHRSQGDEERRARRGLRVFG